MNLEALSALDREAFVTELEGIFENSPWVAAAAWEQRPFATFQALWASLVEAMNDAPEDQRRALICAHPDLAGAAARRGTLTAASTGEQTSSGLLTETEATRRIASLNERYRARFGHPFILAVRGLGPDEILATFEARLQRSPEAEFSECLHQIGRIARFRLEDRFPFGA
jgi:OHCU decarboxylase